jgi:branched-chain amino acid transport system ATP-binding protein
MALLEIRDVRAGYGAGPDILNGVTITIDAGRSACIVGPNGAGKSTTLKAVAGLVKVRSGEVHFDGERISGLRPDEILRRGVCFVPQDRSLFPDMTVRENLAMAGYSISGKAELARRVDEALEMFPILAERRAQRARTMSGGQQQMLALARAWILKPKLLLVDEPTMGLAPQVVQEVFGVIQRFREAGMSLMLVEHNVKEGLGCADWGYVLDLGRNGFDGPSGSILANPSVRELYLGKRVAQHTEKAL